ncbi:Rab effector Noc2 [Sarcoptes scabiei]|uniref:Rab effector Noc2 n=2 Tax=Sarcoptes scabiei TaxID=52283 RepID=A0A834R2L2_SARSC|nr:Rab effector Noc2 [Sarcoptes scabiei]UXI14761.1 p15-2B protein [Sarcoptes scabiei]
MEIDEKTRNTCSNWTCPNDRELLLRAKLETGWSFKTNSYQNFNTKNDSINEQERSIIVDVLMRAQKSEEIENKRICKMIERLKNLRKAAKGDGRNHCLLCDESFGFLMMSAHICQKCKKYVCSRCGIDTLNQKNQIIWLCKICSEIKEILKKSGFRYHEVIRQIQFDMN